MIYNYNKFITFSSLLLLIITIFLFSINFSSITGYWYDEWCTLLTSDPNSSLEVLFERLAGNHEKPNENVPAIYYLILRIFFNFFGYTSENGRIFSIIFYILSSLSFFSLSKIFLNNFQSFFLSSVFVSTPLIFWMANETRVDMFLIFFSITNLLIFFRTIKNSNKKNIIFLLFSNILVLSIYPLTISLIIPQLIFLIFKKKMNLLIIVVLSIIIYFIFNYEYFLEKSLNKDHHFATLNYKFFLGYFFNVFFGSVFFGAIYLCSFTYFLIKNYQKILKNELLTFIVFLIFTTYLMVITSSLFVTPISAPRYIIFNIPLILIFIYTNVFIFEKKKSLFYFFLIISITNIMFNYDEQYIKKPKIDETLQIVKNLEIKNLHFEPATKLFTNYILTIKNIEKYKLLNKKDVKNINVKKFVLVCLNNPSYQQKIKGKNHNKQCLKKYYGYHEVKRIEYNDFLIRVLALKKRL